MSDPLETAIANSFNEWCELRKQADDLVHKAAIAYARMDALKAADKLRPLSTRSRLGEVTSSRGRQPGAISQKWRSILLAMRVEMPLGADENEIILFARSYGLPNIRVKDVRERMQRYEQHGFVENVGSAGWLVTEAALEKFGSSASSDLIDADDDDDEL